MGNSEMNSDSFIKRGTLNMQTIQITRHNGVGWLKWNRPEKLNALNETLLKEAAEAMQDLVADEDVRVIVLVGEGRAFSSGQDLTIESDADYGTYLEDVYHPLVRALASCPKPLIAGIHGVVAGAGLSLALAADVRIVARSTKFSSAFIKIGLVADAGGPYHLKRLMRPDLALSWMWSGRTIDAEQAERFGLVTELVEDDVYTKALTEYAEALAKQSPVAVEGMKALFRAESFEAGLEEEIQWQRKCGQTDIHRQAMHAFLTKK